MRKHDPGTNDAEFSAYVVAHRRRVVRVAYLLCGSWAGAEDITQIALTKLYAAWPRITSHPDAYLHRILVRTAVDEHRRSWVRELPVGEGLPALAERGSSSDVAGAPSAGPELGSALLALPLRQRQAVVLRHYWGLSVAETAAALRISTGNVKSHTSRGLHRLQQTIRPRRQEAEEVGGR